MKGYSEATGQDGHSVLVDYEVFQKVAPPGPDPLTLYQPSDFDFRLHPGSAPLVHSDQELGHALVALGRQIVMYMTSF